MHTVNFARTCIYIYTGEVVVKDSCPWDLFNATFSGLTALDYGMMLYIYACLGNMGNPLRKHLHCVFVCLLVEYTCTMLMCKFMHICE